MLIPSFGKKKSVEPIYYDPNRNAYTGADNSAFKKVNGLEIFVILICIAGLLSSFVVGFISQNVVNRDKQRERDMAQILLALDDFYKNSSLIPSQRSYPKAVCSGSLNEVDFEFTLKRSLTGKDLTVDTHTYINEVDFPRDKSGVYSDTFAKRKIPFRCPEKLKFETEPALDSLIYPDSTTQSCNFNQAKKLTQCYLYASSTNGDTFRLAYWRESTNNFVKFRKFREQAVVREL